MTLQLDATPRVRGAKMDGMIPAVIYGKHVQSTPIFINTSAFTKIYKEAGESNIVSLKLDGKTVNVMIQDRQIDPVKSHIIHADLYVIEKGQKVHVAIPLLYVGESFAVKNLGANLVKTMHELNVSGDPTLLPHEITINIEALAELNSSILVKDLNLPKGVELYHVNPDDVVASVVAQVEEDLSAPATLDMSAIEVEKKGKKEEETAE